MCKSTLQLTIILLCIGVLSACDNTPPLERTTISDQARLTGTFYTESPDDLVFPVKVLFAIDCSGSMGAAGDGSDPSNRRLAAARAFVDQYNGYPNISFEIMLWNQGIYRATQVDGDRGFTKDPGEINNVLANVVNTGTTDYVGTIEAIHEDIARDIANVDTHESLVRTKYVVLFFSDGLDNVPGVTGQRVSETLNAISDITEMVDEEGVGDFTFNTIMLPGINMT
ncbi:MAG: VWA domain-containing protein, partial [Desulfatitalea sp.]|nr:VWA domain-containing protein [Desulfatitalea sp.]NNK00974.1 VWA domain-containing protein [Desulfatitalea sp.]